MTLQQLINQALGLVGGVAAGVDATATESADILRALNQMMALWAEDDKDLNYPPQDTLGDTLPVPLWAEEAIVYNLAVRAAGLFNLNIPPTVAMGAMNGERFIAKKLISDNLQPADLTHMPSGTGNYGDILNGTSR